MIAALTRKIALKVSASKAARTIFTKYGMRNKDSFVFRFIAGESLEEAIQAAQELNKKGITATLDRLGENVNTEEEAWASGKAAIETLDKINETKVDANLSVKLTQLGFDLGDHFCRDVVSQILERSQKHNIFVRIDMEGSAYTQKTIDLFNELKMRGFDNIGIVIQSYLYRSAEDIDRYNKDGVRIRLCKGAYSEPKDISFQKKTDTDKNYERLMESLITNGTYPAIATHDENIINITKEFVKKNNIPLSRFEFQMLYGIRRDLQDSLVKDGYNVRIYIPYGTEWFPYFTRRLGERPANFIFIAKNILRD